MLAMQKRQCTIVFRSFGTDILEVAEEVNMFATGEHPCYPGVGGPCTLHVIYAPDDAASHAPVSLSKCIMLHARQFARVHVYASAHVYMCTHVYMCM